MGRAVARVATGAIFFLHVAGLEGATAPPTYVSVTVDVESRVGREPQSEIWGITADSSEAHGIDKIMDILDSKEVKGTFFLNVYEMARHGESELARAAQRIHSRGHDLQLHSHPGRMYGIQGIAQGDLQQQLAILKEGKRLLLEWTGKRVIAHRAGGFRANLETLDACRLAGLAVDASLSPASRHTELARQLPPYNKPVVLRGVLELPVTYYAQAKLGSWQSLRIVDLEASTLSELTEIVQQAQAHSLPLVNILMHSFSFVRYGAPDFELEERFERLLDFLSSEQDVQPITVSEFYDVWESGQNLQSAQDGFVPYTGWWLTYLRAVEDYDQGWKNVVVAFGPPVTAVLWILVLALWRFRRRRAGSSRPGTA